jgi:hypothetical protein
MRTTIFLFALVAACAAEQAPTTPSEPAQRDAVTLGTGGGARAVRGDVGLSLAAFGDGEPGDPGPSDPGGRGDKEPAPSMLMDEPMGGAPAPAQPGNAPMAGSGAPDVNPTDDAPTDTRPTGEESLLAAISFGPEEVFSTATLSREFDPSRLPVPPPSRIGFGISARQADLSENFIDRFHSDHPLMTPAPGLYSNEPYKPVEIYSSAIQVSIYFECHAPDEQFAGSRENPFRIETGLPPGFVITKLDFRATEMRQPPDISCGLSVAGEWEIWGYLPGEAP